MKPSSGPVARGFGAYTPSVTGSGGGGPAPGGTVQWGPNFGGTDGDKYDIGVNSDLASIGLSNSKTIGVQPRMPALALAHSKTVGVAPTMPTLGLSGDKTIGVTGSMSLGVANDKTIGIAGSMPALALAHSKTIGAHLSGSVLGAPFWQSVATATNSTAGITSIVVNKPTGVVEGDLLLAFVDYNSNPLGGPTGFSISGFTFHDAVNNGGFGNQLFYKIAGASEPSTYTVNVSGGSVDQCIVEMHCIRGVDPTTPIDAYAKATLSAASLDPDPSAPAVTTTVANTLVLAHLFHSHLALSQTHTEPANHVEVTDLQSTVASVLFGSTTAWRVFAAAATQAAVEFNCTETVATDAAMVRVALRPASVVIAT